MMTSVLRPIAALIPHIPQEYTVGPATWAGVICKYVRISRAGISIPVDLSGFAVYRVVVRVIRVRIASGPHCRWPEAFFISPYGEMGTNRHIAVPWDYLSKASISEINQQMQECVGNTGKLREALLDILSNNVKRKVLSYETAVAYLERFSKSGFNISGHFEYLGVILPGHNVSTISDLMSCQVIAESGDPKKDVALIRLNSQQTPEFIVTNGYYSIDNARTDETMLKITEEQLRIIGYPGGMQIGFKTGNGAEINPTVHTTTLSKVPDDNEFQLQTVGLGGQSGSPIIDSNRNLVGVFYSGLEGNEIAYGCNIKHLVELFNRYKVRK